MELKVCLSGDVNKWMLILFKFGWFLAANFKALVNVIFYVNLIKKYECWLFSIEISILKLLSAIL